ncbi:hypothetical protein IFR04_014173, partial [Cadophora malorum]
MAAVVAAVAASSVLGGMYLNGKLGLARDIREIRNRRAQAKAYREAGQIFHLPTPPYPIPTSSKSPQTNTSPTKRKIANPKPAQKNRLALYYFFEHSVLTQPNAECIWSRSGSYTYQQTSHLAHQYAQFFLSLGVQPGQYVNFYLTNTPDFLFAWLGLWAIGAAPAMINYNLSGKALLHCLGVSKAELMLVDDESELRERIEGVRGEIEGELGCKVVVLDT